MAFGFAKESNDKIMSEIVFPKSKKIHPKGFALLLFDPIECEDLSIVKQNQVVKLLGLTNLDDIKKLHELYSGKMPTYPIIFSNGRKIYFPKDLSVFTPSDRVPAWNANNIVDVGHGVVYQVISERKEEGCGYSMTMGYESYALLPLSTAYFMAMKTDAFKICLSNHEKRIGFSNLNDVCYVCKQDICHSEKTVKIDLSIDQAIKQIYKKAENVFHARFKQSLR